MCVIKALCRSLILVAVSVIMSSCGGGSGGNGSEAASPVESPAPQPPGVPASTDSIEGTLKVNVTSIPIEDVAQRALVVDADGHATFSGSSARIMALKGDDTVLFPANPDAGRPIAYLGRVLSVTKADGVARVTLRQAYVEEVYERLSWDLDTANQGARVLGMAGPAGAGGGGGGGLSKVAFTPRQLGELAVNVSGLSGEISYSEPFIVQGEEFTLSVSLSLVNISARSKAEFDATKYFSGGGWGQLSATVSGTITGKVKITSKSGVRVSLGEVFHDSKAWSKLQWKHDGVFSRNGLFSLEGLDDSDKKGLVPLGGLVIAPLIGTVAYRGDQIEDRNILNALAAASATVISVYVDASGNISVNGEAGISLDKETFQLGRTFTLRGASYDVTANDSHGGTSLHVLGTGTFNADQKLGVRVTGDVLIGGIRPLSASAFVGIKYQGSFKGEEVALQLYPTLDAFGPWGCVDSSLWAGIDGDIAMRVKGTLALPSFGLDVLKRVPTRDASAVHTWHAVGAELFNKKVTKGVRAVCWGDLSPNPVELAIGASAPLQVVEPGTSIRIRDLFGADLIVPDRVKWKVSDPTLLSLTADSGGASLTGRDPGVVRVVASDGLTGWRASTPVVVGATCAPTSDSYVDAQGITQTHESITCVDSKGNKIAWHDAQYGVDAQGKTTGGWFHTEYNTPTLRTELSFSTYGYLEKQAIQPKDPAMPYGSEGERYEVHGEAMAPTGTDKPWDSEIDTTQWGPNDAWISYNLIQCSGTDVSQRVVQNGVDQTFRNPVGVPCPGYSEVDAINDIGLTDNPLYVSYKKRFP